jgi:hypothetical protein
MSGFLRVFLMVSALLVLAFVIRRVRKAEMRAADTVFWFLLAASFVLLAAFPRIAFFFSDLLGVTSPANFVFLFVIAVLFIREFASAIEIARLRGKIDTLVQEIALAEHEHKRERRGRGGDGGTSGSRSNSEGTE